MNPTTLTRSDKHSQGSLVAIVKRLKAQCDQVLDALSAVSDEAEQLDQLLSELSFDEKPEAVGQPSGRPLQRLKAIAGPSSASQTEDADEMEEDV